MQHLLPVLLTVCAILGLSNGFLLSSSSKWNGLKATWGVNPFSSFGNLPRTKSSALSSGWQKYGSDVGCNGNALFRGERYWKDNDLAIILIYDPAGYIAGIQAGIPQNYSPNVNKFPFPPLQGSPMVLDNGIYFITAYFVDPSSLCTGRSSADFGVEGTGNGLWIQNGTDPERNLAKAPMTEQAADASRWTRGACFVTMGRHFWYELSENMNCDYFYPVFLLYNGGKLNGFGWAFGMEITTSSRLEHPPSSSYGHFMNTVPKCLGPMGTLTTLHIYMTDSALMDTC